MQRHSTAHTVTLCEWIWLFLNFKNAFRIDSKCRRGLSEESLCAIRWKEKEAILRGMVWQEGRPGCDRVPMLQRLMLKCAHHLGSPVGAFSACSQLCCAKAKSANSRCSLASFVQTAQPAVETAEVARLSIPLLFMTLFAALSQQHIQE